MRFSPGDFLSKGMRQLKDNKAMHTDRNSASLHSAGDG